MNLDVFKEMQSVFCKMNNIQNDINELSTGLKSERIQFGCLHLYGEEKDIHVRMAVAHREHDLFKMKRELENLKEQL